jgi:hypothetical protein
VKVLSIKEFYPTKEDGMVLRAILPMEYEEN